MAKSRPSVQKRANEAGKIEKKRLKRERAALRQAEAEQRAALVSEGIDPDLDGIVPGPQPIQTTDDDWDSGDR